VTQGGGSKRIFPLPNTNSLQKKGVEEGEENFPVEECEVPNVTINGRI
jgi:hypothetical protein